jgi:hypothetical protein
MVFEEVKMQAKHVQGPYNFNDRDVYYDTQKNEFWDPTTGSYLDHEIGLILIDLYFGHHKAPLGPKGKK